MAACSLSRLLPFLYCLGRYCLIVPLLLLLQHFTLNFKKNQEAVISVSAVCTWDVRGSSISKKERESKRWQRNSENRRRELPPEKMGFSAMCHMSGDGEGVGLTALCPFFFFICLSCRDICSQGRCSTGHSFFSCPWCFMAGLQLGLRPPESGLTSSGFQ